MVKHYVLELQDVIMKKIGGDNFPIMADGD